MEIKLTEKEVEDYIFEKQGLEQYGIKCISRQVQMGEAGIVDILGWDRNLRAWVIVEIKRDGLDSKAYAQAMRYRSWLSDYLICKTTMRSSTYNEPYVLLIGTGVSDDLRFVRDVDVAVGRSVRNSYYSIYNIEHEVSLGNFSSRTADSYYDGVNSDMERRLG